MQLVYGRQLQVGEDERAPSAELELSPQERSRLIAELAEQLGIGRRAG